MDPEKAAMEPSPSSSAVARVRPHSDTLPHPPPPQSPPLSYSRPASMRIRINSRPGTIHSMDENSFIDANSERHNLMVKYLYTRAKANQWFDAVQQGTAGTGTSTPRAPSDSASDASTSLGVLLRVSRGQYAMQPSNLSSDMVDAVRKLNVEVAFTMSTNVTDLIFDGLAPDQQELFFKRDSSQYQIVDSMAEIAAAPAGRLKKYQYSCLVRQERAVLVWGNSVDEILERGLVVEKKMLDHIWGRPTLLSPGSGMASGMATPREPKENPAEVAEVDATADVDLEEQVANDSLSRPLVLTSAIFVGLAICLNVVLLFGLGLQSLIGESLIDGSYIRFALVAVLPAFSLFGLFFVIVIFGNLFQAFGPITNVQRNSRSYSYFAPNLMKAYSLGFKPPHITIQMPVYKESLHGVIEPTIRSLREAISHYELSGGMASIFVNDDGLQLLDEEEARARMDYYEDNNIGWVARPAHGKDGFIRAGKFKKASNMNYALDISNKTEDVLLQFIEEKMRDEKTKSISDVEEEELYLQALSQVVEADGVVWASGNIRVGEHILIIDSDTRVPVDCLMNGAAEMFLSPEVAIIQHASGVMQVVGDFFENGVTFFTNLIYSSIQFSIGSGEVAPFVGHNAFLRWQAVQSVSFQGADGKQKFWSESHVSEDFDIALRLQIKGNIVRLACYQGHDFKEGVSLTVFDELARWTKYAYGCNELVFHPIYTWLWRGPFTPLFRMFVTSNLQLSSKITIIGYISTYYALAFGLPMTLANYLLIGWYNAYVDKFYIDSWKIFVGLLVVFSGMGNVTLAILRYRLGEQGLLKALLTNFKWLPMFTIFFGGLSFHLSLALLAHMFSINMSWGATAKELEKSNFFLEIPKIFRTFKWMYLCTISIIAGMIYLGVAAPDGWQITEAVAIVPLAINVSSHILLPFVLNPALMIFNY